MFFQSSASLGCLCVAASGRDWNLIEFGRYRSFFEQIGSTERPGRQNAMEDGDGSNSDEAHEDEAFFRRHLHLRPQSCRQNECPINRDDDPFCLCRLENRTRRPLRKQNKIVNRPEATPAGLENLGNICYMNSYLQTVFHILPFRRIVYDWHRPPPENREPEKRYDVVEELQRLFARLQTTRESTVSPKALVQLVNIDVSFQQDTHEFSLLFIDWIDKVIAEKKGEEKLRSLFTGKCKSVVKCRTCQAESTSENEFSDFGLQIIEMEELAVALKEYFKEEKIDDYACEKCKGKSVADKRLRVVTLPRFLNVNLLRFVYDTELNTRKKLQHAVEYPKILDLRPFLEPEQVKEWGEQGCSYELTAVLIHRGDAHSGHYYARIRVAGGGNWYTFDDEIVRLYESKIENPNDFKGAYLLVYERQKDVERHPTIPEIPDDVDARDRNFQIDRQLHDIRTELGDAGPHRFLSHMKVRVNSPIMWVPTEWLISMVATLQHGALSDPIVTPSMTDHVCIHKKLGNVRGLKAIDYTKALLLGKSLTAFPAPVLDGSMFCPSCTTNSFSAPRGVE